MQSHQITKRKKTTRQRTLSIMLASVMTTRFAVGNSVSLMVKQRTFKADDQDARTWHSDDGTTWVDNDNSGMTAHNKWYAWRPSGNGAPPTLLSFSTLTDKVGVTAAFNKILARPLTSSIKINSPNTLQLSYL